MVRLWSAVFGCSLIAIAADPELRREEGYWVQTRTEEVPIAANGRLQLYTYGRVTVSGGDSAQSKLMLTQRVRARSEAEANALLRRSTLSTRTNSGTTVVRVRRSGEPAVATEMQISTRRNLAHVKLDTHGGDVHVRNIAGQVDAESGGGFIKLDEIGGDVSARTAGGEIRLGRIGGTVRCFSGGGSIEALHAGRESWFETAGGDIYIGETRGPLYASTAGGNIQIGRAGASVSARTAGGRIEVEHAQGIVMAGNAAGSIHIGTAQGVRCESTGGSIRLKGSAGALRAVTDIGSILAELLPGLALQDSVLSTGAGDITVFIPSNLALTIKALNESGRAGRIVSEFNEIPVRRPGGYSQQGAVAEGALNGGGPLLMLTSSGGTIYLRRQR
jgi:DUF4097 and DUF4098 domain-containing protein YvlB